MMKRYENLLCYTRFRTVYLLVNDYTTLSWSFLGELLLKLVWL